MQTFDQTQAVAVQYICQHLKWLLAVKGVEGCKTAPDKSFHSSTSAIALKELSLPISMKERE